MTIQNHWEINLPSMAGADKKTEVILNGENITDRISDIHIHAGSGDVTTVTVTYIRSGVEGTVIEAVGEADVVLESVSFDELSEGWKGLANTRKHHYFVEGRSLCGRWLNFGSINENEQSDTQQNFDCKGCWQQLRNRRVVSDE